MRKFKHLSSNSVLEFEKFDKYKVIQNDIEETLNFFRYTQLINQLAYREGFTEFVKI